MDAILIACLALIAALLVSTVIIIFRRQAEETVKKSVQVEQRSISQVSSNCQERVRLRKMQNPDISDRDEAQIMHDKNSTVCSVVERVVEDANLSAGDQDSIQNRLSDESSDSFQDAVSDGLVLDCDEIEQTRADSVDHLARMMENAYFSLTKENSMVVDLSADSEKLVDILNVNIEDSPGILCTVEQVKSTVVEPSDKFICDKLEEKYNDIESHALEVKASLLNSEVEENDHECLFSVKNSVILDSEMTVHGAECFLPMNTDFNGMKCDSIENNDKSAGTNGNLDVQDAEIEMKNTDCEPGLMLVHINAESNVDGVECDEKKDVLNSEISAERNENSPQMPDNDETYIFSPDVLKTPKVDNTILSLMCTQDAQILDEFHKSLGDNAKTPTSPAEVEITLVADAESLNRNSEDGNSQVDALCDAEKSLEEEDALVFLTNDQDNVALPSTEAIKTDKPSEDITIQYEVEYTGTISTAQGCLISLVANSEEGEAIAKSESLQNDASCSSIEGDSDTAHARKNVYNVAAQTALSDNVDKRPPTVKIEGEVGAYNKHSSGEVCDYKENQRGRGEILETTADNIEQHKITDIENWKDCLYCFEEKMLSLGVSKTGLDAFVSSSNVNLICSTHKTVHLKHQDASDTRAEEKRAIKIVKRASFDAAANVSASDSVAMNTMIIKDSLVEDSHALLSPIKQTFKDSNDNIKIFETGSEFKSVNLKDQCDNSKPGIEDNDKFENIVAEGNEEFSSVQDGNKVIELDILTFRTSQEDLNAPKTTQEEALSNDNMSTEVNVNDKPRRTVTHKPTQSNMATMQLLYDLGERLEFESKQRRRADDWAEFLSLELEAHIDARTSAEERYVILRERMMRLVGKYKKLKSEHVTLVTQINDIAAEDAPPHAQAPSRSTLRRNMSQGDRKTLMAKRNAMLIRGPRRQGSTDSDSEESHIVESSCIKMATNVDDVKQKFETERKTREVSDDISEVSSVHNQSVDLADLSEGNIRDKFKQEMAPYNKYTTSTPIKGAVSLDALHVTGLPKNLTVSAILDKEPSKSFPDVRIEHVDKDCENEEKSANVNVMAVKNMWEKKLQSLPFQTVTNAPHDDDNRSKMGDSNANIKRMKIKNDEQLKKKMEETAKAVEKGVKLDKHENMSGSSDSDDEEFFDVDSPGDEFGNCSEFILTKSINTKETMTMWKNMAESRNCSENSATKSKSSMLAPGALSHVKACFESPASTTHAHEHGQAPLERSNKFASLRSQWEHKGKENNDSAC